MPLAKPEVVRIWRINLDQPRGLFLSPAEKDRAARFHFQRDRERWARARSALREILADVAHRSPLQLTFDVGPQGKPSLRDHLIEFNLSHSGEWALVAVSAHSPVGVDIEGIRHDVEIAKLLHRIGEDAPDVPTEELFQLWSRREARSKAAGVGLMDLPPDSIHAVRLQAPSGYAACVALVDALPDPHYFGSL